MSLFNKLRAWTKRPNWRDEQDMNAFHDWVTATLNTLIGSQVPGAQGLHALNPGTVDPTSGTMLSGGSRTSSLTTAFKFSTTTTSISFQWDGTNGSTPLSIYRDDGTIVTPIVGNLTISGLTPNTPYFFYPYYDEVLQKVVFASVPGAVGTPPVAYTAPLLLAAQQQLLRGHVPLASTAATTGVATPNAGTTTGSAAGGGGSVGIHLSQRF